MKKLLSCLILLTTFLGGAQIRPEEEKTYFLPRFARGEVYAGSEDEWRIPLAGKGWELTWSRDPLYLIVSKRDHAAEMVEANLPATHFSFPWTGYGPPANMRVRIYSPGASKNLIRLTMRDRAGFFYWQDIELTRNETTFPVLAGADCVEVYALSPVVAYVVWEREHDIVWVDPGEAIPEQKGIAEYAIVARGGDPVALQLELGATGKTLYVRRPPFLRPQVNLVWNEVHGRIKAVWVAADVKPIGASVIGFLGSKEQSLAFPPTLAAPVIAADVQGNPFPVGIDLQPIL